MNLAEIVAQARDWLDDEAEPYLWSDEALTRWANEAQVEVAVRTRCLVDDTTPEVCTVTVVAGTAVYPLHPSIAVVRRYEYRRASVMPEVLARRTTNWMDRNFGGQWTGQIGRPYIAIPDLSSRTFRLDRIPTADDVGTIQLTVWRKPLDAEKLEGEEDEPAFDDAYHMALVNWICHRAYLKRDPETYSRPASDDHLGQFVAAVGNRPTLQRLIELSTDDSGEVESHWF